MVSNVSYHEANECGKRPGTIRTKRLPSIKCKLDGPATAFKLPPKKDACPQEKPTDLEQIAKDAVAALKDEWSIGTFSTFCDEGDYDSAEDEDIVAMLLPFLKKAREGGDK
jgi:hypothetical protein